jgi:hypothetical protein
VKGMDSLVPPFAKNAKAGSRMGHPALVLGIEEPLGLYTCLAPLRGR